MKIAAILPLLFAGCVTVRPELNRNCVAEADYAFGLCQGRGELWNCEHFAQKIYYACAQGYPNPSPPQWWGVWGQRLTLVIEWNQQPTEAVMKVFYRKCERAWNGDEFGNEWTQGVAIITGLGTIGPGTFEVFEDDGEGNGDFLASFATLSAARSFANDYVEMLDNGIPVYKQSLLGQAIDQITTDMAERLVRS